MSEAEKKFDIYEEMGIACVAKFEISGPKMRQRGSDCNVELRTQAIHELSLYFAQYSNSDIRRIMRAVSETLGVSLNDV